ncbi:unnamed protein product, partial [Mesorhabditis spiculigera]
MGCCEYNPALKTCAILVITVDTTIPVVIGSGLGSSMVNSFVSMAYSGDKEQFRLVRLRLSLPALLSGDMAIGVIVVVGSVIALICCLCGIVHLITPFKWLTGYIIMFIGMVVTLLLQSNSIFSSSLTPLVGIGVISLKKVYPLSPRLKPRMVHLCLGIYRSNVGR